MPRAAPRPVVIGRWSMSFDDSHEPREAARAQPGTYWIRVTPRGLHGGRYAPVVSGPVRLDAGRHELAYALLPCGALSVRLPQGGLEGWRAALEGPAGQALPEDDGATSRALGDGRFLRLDPVPVGAYVLVLTPPDGGAARKLAVEVTANETARYVVGD
ncbi:MAG: hypothetical protein H6828_11730 [Planctomycetes bacterium]|nr:hypothetical protein [Planctomycetota bacterium]